MLLTVVGCFDLHNAAVQRIVLTTTDGTARGESQARLGYPES